jgi:phage gp46-like protein
VNASGGDIVIDANSRIVEGEPIIAEMLASLYTDAPPLDGDPVPEGVERDGYCATAFDPTAIRGSRLWLVPYIRPVSRAMTFAQGAASDALARMVGTRVTAVDVTASNPKPGRIDLAIHVTLLDETRKTFALAIDYAI